MIGSKSLPVVCSLLSVVSHRLIPPFIGADFPARFFLSESVSFFLLCSLVWSIGLHAEQVCSVNAWWLPLAPPSVKDRSQALITVIQTASGVVVARFALRFRFLHALVPLV